MGRSTKIKGESGKKKVFCNRKFGHGGDGRVAQPRGVDDVRVEQRDTLSHEVGSGGESKVWSV